MKRREGGKESGRAAKVDKERARPGTVAWKVGRDVYDRTTAATERPKKFPALCESCASRALIR